jgi:hypothetical protein
MAILEGGGKDFFHAGIFLLKAGWAGLFQVSAKRQQKKKKPAAQHGP